MTVVIAPSAWAAVPTRTSLGLQNGVRVGTDTDDLEAATPTARPASGSAASAAVARRIPGSDG